ncbi:flagellar basal-body rod protein FlgF [Aurantimonas marina]|uniref:flagellar basal-body rod protein FlgF n=1 Tax=Aurantimonas marina TaxID=2780508 RepID=UPI0019D1A88F|nr:flagellar basal-body rod protein FlgF [Aurantimonas marina]
MQTALPVALSAQLALEKRLDTIAHNVANARTAGFRAEEVKFEALISRVGSEPVTFASEGTTYLSTRAGEMTQTGNTLDMAVSGDAFFAMQGPNGPVYTRDGRMRINAEGSVETINGYPVLDVGGATLQVDPNAGPIAIARDGMITQNGGQIGAVGLFAMPPGANLTRFENSGVIPDQAAVPILDFGDVGIMQGFVEGSNVNPVLEISRLIALQRAFESASNLVQTSERTLDDAVKNLGNMS